MYDGEAQTVLDDKGRITVASQFRKAMEVFGHAIWYMTRGFDGAIFLFPKEQWDKIREQSNAYSAMDSRAVDFRRIFFGGATQVKPDNQGRMPVPPYLREYAGLDRDAVLVGCDDHLELWSRAGWSAFQKNTMERYKEMGHELFKPAASGDAAGR